MKVIISESQYLGFINESMQAVSLQTAKDTNMFYPVYHGTSEESYKNILDKGFSIPKGQFDQAKRNSYLLTDYWGGIPAPTDHLGFGVYFTTVKNIAKNFAKFNDKNSWTGKKVLPEYALKVDNLETINFGSPKTMMKWWIDNGYDVEMAKEALRTNNYGLRDEATRKMTEVLKSKYDAVFYKGQGLYKLLDGNQICVYDPKNIFIIDKKAAKQGEIGSKVTLLDGRKGTIVNVREIQKDYMDYISNPENFEKLTTMGKENAKKALDKNNDGKYYDVKLTKGGTIRNLYNTDFM